MLNNEDKAAVLEDSEGDGLGGDCLFVAKRLAEPWTEFTQAHIKKSWKLSLFGRDPDGREVGVGEEEEETAATRLKEMEKLINITVVDPARYPYVICNGLKFCHIGTFF